MLITFPELLMMVMISVAGILDSAPSAVVVAQNGGVVGIASVVCAQFPLLSAESNVPSDKPPYKNPSIVEQASKRHRKKTQPVSVRTGTTPSLKRPAYMYVQKCHAVCLSG